MSLIMFSLPLSNQDRDSGIYECQVSLFLVSITRKTQLRTCTRRSFNANFLRLLAVTYILLFVGSLAALKQMIAPKFF
jgi:hypothetical protein